MFACIHAPESPPPGELIALAHCFSPLFEVLRPETIVLSMQGMETLLGTPRAMAEAIRQEAGARGFDVRVAIARNPDAAAQAARNFPGVTILEEGEEEDCLGPLPVSLLPLTPDAYQTLDRWGIRTFAQLAALPPDGLTERFGQQGAEWRKMARGQSPRPLIPYLPSMRFEESIELDYPVDLLEPLLFLLSRMLNDLCAQLKRQSMAMNELQVELKLETGPPHLRTLRFPVPTAEAVPLLKLLHLDLESAAPPAPVVELAMRANPVPPRRLQGGLFLPQTPEPEKLEVTLARIAGFVGKDRVGSAVLLDTHRPGAFRMERAVGQTAPPRPREHAWEIHLSLRIYRPALRAEVDLADGKPRRLRAPGVRGQVLHYAGPWRTSGDWWREDPWSRDEWDIALSDGALYRIYQDHIEEQWYVEGRYD